MNLDRLDCTEMEIDRHQFNVRTTYRPKTRAVLEVLRDRGLNRSKFTCDAIDEKAARHYRLGGWGWEKRAAARANGGKEEA